MVDILRIGKCNLSTKSGWTAALTLSKTRNMKLSPVSSSVFVWIVPHRRETNAAMNRGRNKFQRMETRKLRNYNTICGHSSFFSMSEDSYTKSTINNALLLLFLGYIGNLTVRALGSSPKGPGLNIRADKVKINRCALEQGT